MSKTDHPVMQGLGLKLGDPVPGAWGGEVDIPYEPQAWDILVRPEQATTEGMEGGQERVTQPPFHRSGLTVHKNLRLGVLAGENFPHILGDTQNTLFRELYRRTLHYLLDSAKPLDAPASAVPEQQRNALEVGWDRPVTLEAARYELPEFVNYQDPRWFLGPAPYAHYVVEGSAEGRNWIILADRRHGPWRGLQTSFFTPKAVRRIRLRGAFSNGEPFRIRNLQAFRGQ